jgi:hypothetical protein
MLGGSALPGNRVEVSGISVFPSVYLGVARAVDGKIHREVISSAFDILVVLISTFPSGGQGTS